jgi:acetolactate synthase-1/2/3 large subunit
MLHPRGPVYMDVPSDVLGHDAVRLSRLEEVPWFELVPAEADLDAAAAVLAGKRVVIWAGTGAVDAEPSVAVLAEHLGAPVVTSFGGRGVPPTAHPAAVGLPLHEPEVAELIGSAEVLLAVGGDLDGMNTRNWTMPARPGWSRSTRRRRPIPGVGAGRRRRRSARRGAAGLRDRLPTHPEWAPRGLRALVHARLAADPATAEAMALVAAVEAARTRRPCWCATWRSRATGSAGTRARQGRAGWPTRSAGAPWGSGCPPRSGLPPPGTR